MNKNTKQVLKEIENNTIRSAIVSLHDVTTSLHKKHINLKSKNKELTLAPFAKKALKDTISMLQDILL